MSTKVEIDGEEVEVHTAKEMETAISSAVSTAKAEMEGQFKPKMTEMETELSTVRRLLGERTSEVRAVRKLSDEQVTKLTETERIIYENGLVLAAEREHSAEANKRAHEASVNAAIRSRVGNDEKLFTEVRKMYDIVQLEDLTTEGVASRAAAAMGALGGVQPDLLASSGWGGGGFEPPQRETGKESIADTERGRDIASRLGIAITEEDVKKQNRQS